MLRIKVRRLAPVTEQNHNRKNHPKSTVCTRKTVKKEESRIFIPIFSSLNSRETKKTITLRGRGRTGNYFFCMIFIFALFIMVLLILAVKANIDLCLGFKPSIFSITSLGLNDALLSFRCASADKMKGCFSKNQRKKFILSKHTYAGTPTHNHPETCSSRVGSKAVSCNVMPKVTLAK